ncbi:MAG: AbrB/MazE/SpoVT family DNA-binding domain-containing protein [Lysobacterales bacterium CG02_land_8_20_14_3_00_62_12]|nr:MAG: AbrB/MazE/SpoVT family DNA-binding domain-containing protein [Xanthomonadales bacterium CG02_land_8_20_14_3_00_62_12]
MNTAKIFWLGHTQAVQLPKQYQLDATEVRIRRQGSAVILEPITNDWDWLNQVQGVVDADFIRAASERPAEQDRPQLDDLQ